MQIYLARNQVQAGPYTLTELNNMLATGQVDLNDLMWHAGMEQWKTVGEMTQGQLHYNPNAPTATNTPPRRVSVAELYGKKEPETTAKSSSEGSTLHTNTESNRFGRKASALKKTASTTALANPVLRIVATLLNFFLFSLTLIPISSNIDADEFYALFESQATQVELLNYIYQNTAQHLMTMSALLVSGLLLVNAILLVKKGQSIGKLITGIRVVNAQDNQLASANTILIRAILASVIYYMTPIGLFLVIGSLVLMFINDRKQTIHDKVFKTVVVKADPKQLEK